MADDLGVVVLSPAFPIERWGIAANIYQSAGGDAEFRVYPGVGHELGSVPADTIDFFSTVLQPDF